MSDAGLASRAVTLIVSILAPASSGGTSRRPSINLSKLVSVCAAIVWQYLSVPVDFEYDPDTLAKKSLSFKTYTVSYTHLRAHET